MIYSVINSQEEMNQQVLYLLGIGRFYTQTKNNQTSEDASQQSQTSLAMQSLLSGTISQQINNVLSSFVNSSNWNFGANISTGNEGFNNAEYEVCSSTDSLAIATTPTPHRVSSATSTCVTSSSLTATSRFTSTIRPTTATSHATV